MTSLGLGLTGSTPIIQRSYTYHAWNEDINGGLLESLTAVNDQSAVLQQLGYSYDRNGNIVSISDDAAEETPGFSYDASHQATDSTVLVIHLKETSSHERVIWVTRARILQICSWALFLALLHKTSLELPVRVICLLSSQRN